MVGQIVILALVAVLPILLVLKNDKQVVHLLEGKLQKRGKDISAAKGVYDRHKEPVSFVLFVVGFWIVVAALVAVGLDDMGLTLAAVGGISAAFGVFGRIRSFRRADQELG